MIVPLNELDGYYAELSNAEDDLMEAKRVFEDAEALMKHALRDAGMSMNEYRATRRDRAMPE